MAKAQDRANNIYDIVSLFADECLLNDGSLLWPGLRVWTLDNLEQLWTAFILNPDESDKSFLEKWSGQLSGSSEDVFRLATEVTALYCLLPYYKQMGSDSKKNLIEDVRVMGPDIGEFDNDRWSMLEAALNEEGIARAGTDYLTKRPFHIGYYLCFALEVKRRDLHSLSDCDPFEIANTVLDISSEAMGFKANGSRNAVLHLFWPNEFEPTASNMHKDRMAINLSSHFDLTPQDSPDATILQARRHMEESGDFPKDFDMYAEDIRPLWDFAVPKKARKSKESVKPTEGNNRTEHHGGDGSSNPSITDLSRATHLDEARLREIETLLNDKKQLIFEGPPGSGKTFVAEKFARYFTGQPFEDSKSHPALADSTPGNDQIEIVQFHQSYGYEDFVEGIRPRTNENGQLVYEVEPGVFRAFAEKARANPARKFVLIIDEINRGNVSRILGELMLLLEYRDKSATLPYSKEKLTIPPNLYIIGTMNSADRSLSQIDYALRRRFYFVRFMSVEEGKASILRSWLNENSANTEGNRLAVDLFIHLNRKLSDRLGTDDLQVGHSYFMRTDIHQPAAQEMVWKYTVMPLLREYLYHDRERDEVLESFALERILTELAPQVAEPELDETNSSDESEFEA